MILVIRDVVEKSLNEECRRSGLSKLVGWLLVREHADLYVCMYLDS